MALVLTRSQNESILLIEEGKQNCRITVIGVKRHGSQWAVRLAIDAPQTVNVVRQELLDGNQIWRREPNAKVEVRD